MDFRRKRQTAEYSATSGQTFHYKEESYHRYAIRLLKELMAIAYHHIRRLVLLFVCIVMVINTVFSVRNLYAVSGIATNNLTQILIARLDTIVKTYKEIE